MGEGGRVAVGRSAFHLIPDCCNETSSDFSYPQDSDSSKSIFLFAKVQQGLCILHIVISLTYHQAHVKTEC